MKKLLIAAAVVCAATLSQAASVNWTTDAFYIPADSTGVYSTSTKAAKGSVVGYLWEVDAATYEIYAADTSKIYTEFCKSGYGDLGTTTIDPAASGMSRNVSLIGETDWGVGDTAYAVILYTYNDGSKDWYVANVAKYEGMDAADATVSKLNLFEGGSIDSIAQGAAITGWTAASGAVPEPTSAMLMLLGVAGLMLKRKRA